MKTSGQGFAMVLVARLIGCVSCGRPQETVPLTGLGSVRPLRRSFLSSSHRVPAALSASESDIELVTAANSLSSSTATNASSSSRVNGTDALATSSSSTSPPLSLSSPSSSSSSFSAEPISANSSASSSSPFSADSTSINASLSSSGATATNSSSSSSSTATLAVIEPISTNSSVEEGTGSTNSSASSLNVTAVEQELVQTLENDEQVTVLGEVQLGELLCDSLGDAEDAPLLRFAISANETMLANQTSYTVISGETFTGGVGRKVWTGTVVDPEPSENEAFARSVSMTWGDICDVETFALRVTRNYIDGNTSEVKSVPCGPSGVDICLVEVLFDFLPYSAPLTVDFNNSGESKPIQVLVLYSEQALDLVGVSDLQMESMVSAAFSTVNTGFSNSDIGIEVTIVHQGLLPYVEGDADSSTKLTVMREDSAVIAERDEYGADIVLLVGELNDVCGIAYFLPNTLAGFSEYAYAAAHPNCFAQFVIGHELGHNLGCEHNREHSSSDMEYAHGYRYCSGTTFTTIMSYTAGCTASRANYFANPDVSYLGRPTGTDTEDCARAIDENKEVVSNFRDKIYDGQGNDDDGGEGDEWENEGTFEWNDKYLYVLILPGIVVFLSKRMCLRRRSHMAISS